MGLQSRRFGFCLTPTTAFTYFFAQCPLRSRRLSTEEGNFRQWTKGHSFLKVSIKLMNVSLFCPSDDNVMTKC